jgi:hypothetical protein
MIVLLWRWFLRWVIGVGQALPPVQRQLCPDINQLLNRCRANVSPLCSDGRCRLHCMHACKCEKALTPDEMDLVRRFRSGRALEGPH